MPLPHTIDSLLQRPSMWVGDMSFDKVVAFIDGFDAACNGGLLLGFREWLIPRIDGPRDVHWIRMVLKLCFLEEMDAHRQPDEPSATLHALSSLRILLHDFYSERDDIDGMHRILLRYDGWLQKQEWYHPE